MLKHLSALGTFAGIAVGAALIIIGYAAGSQSTTEIGVAAFAACLVFLMLSKKRGMQTDTLKAGTNLRLLVHICFFALFILSMFYVNFSVLRPNEYFIITIIAASLVAFSIITNPPGHSKRLIILEIILLAFSLRCGLFYELPGLYGVDPWFHNIISNSWAEAEKISYQTARGFTSYADFPVMHLNLIAYKLIPQLGIKESFLCACGIFYSFSVVLVYYIGSRLASAKIGLLAALLLSINMFHISWGALLVPTSLGIAFMAVIIHLSVKNSDTITSRALLVIFITALVFTHTISSLITFIALSLIIAAQLICPKFFNINTPKICLNYRIVLFAWTAMFIRWIYSYLNSHKSFLTDVLGWFDSTLENDVTFVGSAFKAAEAPSSYFNRVGLLLFIALIIVGILYWLLKRNINSVRVGFIAIAALLTVITFALPFFNIENLIPGRWLPFISVASVSIAATGIFFLSFRGKCKAPIMLSVMGCVFLYGFFMINSSTVNTNGPFYGGDYSLNPLRLSFYEQELSAVGSIGKLSEDTIITDSKFMKLPFQQNVGFDRVVSFRERNMEGLFVIRDYVYKHPSASVLDEDKLESFLSGFEDLTKYHVLYENGAVTAYLPR